MKITKLHLKAFRSFLDVELDLSAPRTLIGGVVGSGKSSCRESLRYALCGKCLDWNGQVLDLGDLPPTFANGSASVAVSVDGLGTVDRTWHKPASPVLQVAAFTGTTTAQQQALYDALKTSEPFLQAVIDSDVFRRLHHADAKKLMLELLNVRVTTDDGTFTLAQLDAKYLQVFEERKQAKARYKVSSVPMQPQPQEHPPLPAIEKRLATLRAELETAWRDGGTVTGQRQTFQARLAQLRLPNSPVLAISEEAAMDQVADLEERLAMMEDGAGEALPEQPAPAAGTTERRTWLLTQIPVIDGHEPDGGCVLDAAIPCETPRAKFRKQAKSMKMELGTLPAPAPASIPAVNPLTAVRKRLDELKATLQIYADFRALHAERFRQREDLQTELDALPKTDDREAQIADLKGRIEKGTGILKAAQAHQEALSAFERATLAHQALEAEVVRLESACEVYGPSGARVPALESAVGPFLERVNLLTGKFGWTVRFVLEPWGVVVNDRPFETFSRSEQYRIGVSIQLAIAEMSGLNLAVIDELDMLDVQTKNIVGRMLYESPVGQIIIMGTREPDSPLPDPEKTPRMRAYRLGKDGDRSTILESTV